jgi:toxin ParE1/3/4
LRVAERFDRVADKLGHMPTGRQGRVKNTYEKVVPGLPYIVAYEVSTDHGDESVAILHVFHGAREWLPGGWPQDEE